MRTSDAQDAPSLWYRSFWLCLAIRSLQEIVAASFVHQQPNPDNNKQQLRRRSFSNEIETLSLAGSRSTTCKASAKGLQGTKPKMPDRPYQKQQTILRTRRAASPAVARRICKKMGGTSFHAAEWLKNRRRRRTYTWEGRAHIISWQQIIFPQQYHATTKE